mgnify:CR=1 FL=1
MGMAQILLAIVIVAVFVRLALVALLCEGHILLEELRASHPHPH